MIKENKNSVDPNLGTEEKIKAAATTVFIQRGYAATKTRDIAEAAGINIASLHYYFRSKEKLYQIIASEAMQKFSSVSGRVFLADIPLHDKIKRFVVEYTDMFKENPFLPLFIFTESEKEATQIFDMAPFKIVNEAVESQLKELSQNNKARTISTDNFFADMLGLTIMPFLNRHIMRRTMGTTDTEFEAMLEERKVLIPEMIINHLYKEKPE